MSGRTPQGNSVLVGNRISIEQKKKSTGHLRRIPVAFDVPAGETKYFDYDVPDYTNGIDVMGAHFLLKGATTGDKAKDMKVLVRPLVAGGTTLTVAEDALAGATSVKVKGPRESLKCTERDGALDEGFRLSFGTDSTTAAGINAATDTQLDEYEIKRLGDIASAGGGLHERTIELFSGLNDPITAGDDVNLIVAYVPQGGAIEIVEGQVFDLGLETLNGQNMPAGSTLRMAYENTGASEYRPRGSISVMY